MNRILTKIQANRNGKDSKPVRVLAAYEDSSTGGRAEEFCKDLSRNHVPKADLTKEMWLFNELRLPQLRTIAAREAANADLIIISVHHAASLPEEVKSWIDLWLARKPQRPPLLLALFDPVYQGDSSSMQTYLKDVARRGKMEFLVQTEDMPESR